MADPKHEGSFSVIHFNTQIFFIRNTIISNARLKLAKNQLNAKQRPEAELLSSKVIGILHSRYHLTITGHILKNKQKNKHVCVHGIMELIRMKMKTKMKLDSRKYGISRPRRRHGHRYSKYMKHLSMMMLICIKQHLSNIWSSVYENVKQHMINAIKNNYMSCMKTRNIRIGKNNANI